jgi:hypothetical protein
MPHNMVESAYALLRNIAVGVTVMHAHGFLTALDFGLQGFDPLWTLDFKVLTPSDFGLRLSGLSVGLRGSPGGTRHIITFTAVLIQNYHANSSTRVRV